MENNVETQEKSLPRDFLDWSGEKIQGMAKDEMRDGYEGWESMITLIQADSRGNWEPLPSSQEGKCYDSNYGNGH